MDHHGGGGVGGGVGGELAVDLVEGVGAGGGSGVGDAAGAATYCNGWGLRTEAGVLQPHVVAGVEGGGGRDQGVGDAVEGRWGGSGARLVLGEDGGHRGLNEHVDRAAARGSGGLD